MGFLCNMLFSLALKYNYSAIYYAENYAHINYLWKQLWSTLIKSAICFRSCIQPRGNFKDENTVLIVSSEYSSFNNQNYNQEKVIVILVYSEFFISEL